MTHYLLTALDVMKTAYLLRLATGLLVVISLILIFKSSQRMSITVDESNHYFCGMQWWQDGKYTAWPENPVFSRILTAAGPYFAGYRTSGFYPVGEELTIFSHLMNSYKMDYFHAEGIDNPLMLIRIFILPMFFISMVFVWLWAKSLSGIFGALIAVGMYAFMPLLMGHAGLATTDITFVSTFVILMWTFNRWLNKASLLNGVWFGIGLAMAILSKYSVFPFFGIALFISLFLKWFLDPDYSFKPFTSWLLNWLFSGAMATVVMFFVIWAFHGFHVGTIGDEPVMKTAIANGEVSEIFNQITVPFPEWFAGFVLLLWHNAGGHSSYMFGEISQMGFWYFYPVGITLKTPIPALILGLFGMAGLAKGFRKGLDWEIVSAFLIPVTMMVSVMSSHINIGIRHIMPIYPLFAVGAAASAVYLLEHINETRKSRVKYSLIGLLATQVIMVFIAYPNFIGYFNLLGGKTPAKIMLGADLDWGQGLVDLSEYTKDHQIHSLYISYYGIADNCMYDLPKLTPLPRNEPVKGWIAISETNYWGLRLFDETAFDIPEGCKPLIFSMYREPEPHTYYRWLDAYEPETILAGSIRLYHIE